MSSVSTGLCITAGGLVLVSDLVGGTWKADKEIRNTVATVVAAFVSAGLDQILPGFGTSLAVILVVGVAIKYAPPILNKLFT